MVVSAGIYPKGTATAKSPLFERYSTQPLYVRCSLRPTDLSLAGEKYQLEYAQQIPDLDLQNRILASGNPGLMLINDNNTLSCLQQSPCRLGANGVARLNVHGLGVAKKTGTRTQVGFTETVSSLSIFWVSHTIFISSRVYPLY